MKLNNIMDIKPVKAKGELEKVGDSLGGEGFLGWVIMPSM